ncbi:MAG: glycine-rich domain-containing protein [Patescibacteria group bacterium]
MRWRNILLCALLLLPLAILPAHAGEGTHPAVLLRRVIPTEKPKEAKSRITFTDGWRRPHSIRSHFRDSWHRSRGVDILGAEAASASSVYGAELSRTQRLANLVDLINQNLLLSVSFVLAAVVISVLGTRSNLRRKCTTMICVLERVMVPLDKHFQHARLLLRFFLLASGMGVLFWLTAVYAAAETAVLVNTEAFYRIDDLDTGADVQLKFGDVVNEQLNWERATGRFRFTDDLYIEGNLEVAGTLSGSSTITLSSLKGCDTIDTTINGVLTCGTDAGPGAAVNIQTFTATGTWTKLTPAPTVTRIQLWGGGGSGGRGGSADAGGGGGGGSYLDVLVATSTLSATETCGVGPGGTVATSNEQNGNWGGQTTFDVYRAYGGGPGFGATNTNGGGGGGACPFANGNIGTASAGGTGGCGAAAGVDDYLGGGGGTVNGGDSGTGGGGGGLGVTSGTEGAGGRSIYGGGGGGGADGGATPTSAGGDSLYGGDGGIGSTATTVATNGAQPGGGGGGSESANSGAGGAGKCIITSW